MEKLLGAAAEKGLDLAQLKALGETIRAHHERFDGQGYPDGLAGKNQMPVMNRIKSAAEKSDSHKDLATD